MKLSYKILWFEDQFNNLENTIQRLERHISEHGFIPDIVRENGVTEEYIHDLSDALDNYNPYDLIIFDYDLGQGSENGLNIAAKLRSTIFTDMIFYSGKVPQDLRKMLFEGEVDGVFVVHRPNFYDEIVPIVDDHIKRMSDINNIRGVTMSAMSVIDNKMRELFLGQCGGLDEKQKEEVLGALKKRLSKRHEERLDNIEKVGCIEDAVLNHLLTDFDIVRVTLKSMYKEGDSGHSALNEESNLFQMQRERNALAHQKDEYTDDGKLILHGKNGGKKEYNFTEFKRIRAQLLSVQMELEKL